MTRTIPLVGVTGSMGSGKTTVSRILAGLGAAVFDADRAAREITRDKDVIERLGRAFGPGVVREDGQLDRSKVAEMVFADPGKLKALNRLIHPLVRARMRRFVAENSGSDHIKMIVVDAPLIFEAGLDRELDYVVVVAVDDETAIQRVMARSEMSRAEVEARQANQMSLAEKMKRADFIIENQEDESRLAERARAVFDRIQAAWHN